MTKPLTPGEEEDLRAAAPTLSNGRGGRAIEAFLATLDAEREAHAKTRKAARSLLEMVEHEKTGDRIKECWCTSSGNEEPPGSVDIPCGACLVRAALGPEPETKL